MLEYVRSKLGIGKSEALQAQVEFLTSQVEDVQNRWVNDYHLFNGEKTKGTLGAPIDVYPDYYAAQQRAWELQLTNSYAKLIIDKWSNWTIGKGLRFNATPYENGAFNSDSFIETVEHRFRTYLDSRYSGYDSMESIQEKAKIVHKNCNVSGDALCVLRIENGKPKLKLIDGSLVITPLKYTTKGNRIIDGVEIDAKGRHAAYWVASDSGEVKRIKAYDPRTGLRYAFMVYGTKFRISETRGYPLLLQDFEKLKMLDRYVEATVQNAEATAKLLYSVEHDNSSTGEDPFGSIGDKASSLSGKKNEDSISDIYLTGEQACGKVARVTGATALNLPVGAKLNVTKPEAEALMPDFLESNLKTICAAAGIPFEVALSIYGSNYSASRASIKDWEHNLKLDRNDFTVQFYKPIYEMFLYLESLAGLVPATGLLTAYSKRDIITIESIQKATFTGENIASIDPLKEVKAVREALGEPEGQKSPLMTYEDGSQQISNSDFAEVQKQVTREDNSSFKFIKDAN